MTTSAQLIVALDYPELDSARKLVKELQGLVQIYKVGSELFTAQGWEAVELVHRSGAKVFLDLKLHDIPTTVARTSQVIAERGIFMFNVHSSGGAEMMRAARTAVDEIFLKGERPLLIAVTVLTSLEEKVLSRDLGIQRPLREQVLALARLAQSAGLNGVVCSPEETEFLRKELGKEFVLVTPGVRPAGRTRDDQSRVATPQEAVRRGSNYLVVGRPVTAASDPRAAASDILQSLA